MKKSVALFALGLALSSCGPLSARGPLEQTTRRLGDIRSGNMMLEVTAATEGGAKSGFRLEGPFSLPTGASLPAADLDYRRLGPGQNKPISFVSTGKAAYVKVGDQAYRVPREKVSNLQGRQNAGSRGPFDRLRISDWVKEPRTSEGPRMDGVATEIVKGELQVAAALNNIFEVARELGKQDLPTLTQEEAERLNRAVESATLELITGKSDRLLRRLSLQIDLAGDAPRELGAEIQQLLGVSFGLTLALENPNKPVKVSPPRDPLPLSRLDSL